MEENSRYRLIFLYLDEEVFVWDTAATPIIPRQNEEIFLVTDLPSRGQGKWWIVNEVTYNYHIAESSAELKQHITIHVEPWAEKKSGFFRNRK